MSCNTCLKANRIPRCIDTDEFTILGLSFSGNTDETLGAIFKDVATGREVTIEFETDVNGDAVIDLAEVFPLDNHPYEIRFITIDGVPVEFTVTNIVDSSTVDGCCIEFETLPRDVVGSDSWYVTTTSCQV